MLHNVFPFSYLWHLLRGFAVLVTVPHLFKFIERLPLLFITYSIHFFFSFSHPQRSKKIFLFFFHFFFLTPSENNWLVILIHPPTVVNRKPFCLNIPNPISLKFLHLKPIQTNHNVTHRVVILCLKKPFCLFICQRLFVLLRNPAAFGIEIYCWVRINDMTFQCYAKMDLDRMITDLYTDTDFF